MYWLTGEMSIRSGIFAKWRSPEKMRSRRSLYPPELDVLGQNSADRSDFIMRCRWSVSHGALKSGGTGSSNDRRSE